jgi:hypothetical protein
MASPPSLVELTPEQLAAADVLHLCDPADSGYHRWLPVHGPTGPAIPRTLDVAIDSTREVEQVAAVQELIRRAGGPGAGAPPPAAGSEPPHGSHGRLRHDPRPTASTPAPGGAAFYEMPDGRYVNLTHVALVEVMDTEGGGEKWCTICFAGGVGQRAWALKPDEYAAFCWAVEQHGRS